MYHFGSASPARRRKDIVVIGSGALGSSVPYHLAALGQTKVALLDRFAIASQTSPRAARLTQQIRPDPELTRLAMLSVAKIARFAEETGEPLVYHRSGSVKMARTDADARQIKAEIEAGRAAGLEIRAIAASDLPTMTADGRLIVGPVPGLGGFYAATGCCVGGLSISPAVGQTLAELILTGRPSLSLDRLAITRFGPDVAADDQLEAACVRTYAHQYTGGWESVRV